MGIINSLTLNISRVGKKTIAPERNQSVYIREKTETQKNRKYKINYDLKPKKPNRPGNKTNSVQFGLLFYKNRQFNSIQDRTKPLPTPKYQYQFCLIITLLNFLLLYVPLMFSNIILTCFLQTTH